MNKQCLLSVCFFLCKKKQASSMPKRNWQGHIRQVTQNPGNNPTSTDLLDFSARTGASYASDGANYKKRRGFNSTQPQPAEATRVLIRTALSEKEAVDLDVKYMDFYKAYPNQVINTGVVERLTVNLTKGPYGYNNYKDSVIRPLHISWYAHIKKLASNLTPAACIVNIIQKTTTAAAVTAPNYLQGGATTFNTNFAPLALDDMDKRNEVHYVSTIGMSIGQLTNQITAGIGQRFVQSYVPKSNILPMQAGSASSGIIENDLYALMFGNTTSASPTVSLMFGLRMAYTDDNKKITARR